MIEFLRKKTIKTFYALFRVMSGRKVLISIPYIWLIIFFLFPCLILLKISLSESVLASPPFTTLSEWLSSSQVLNIKLNFSNYCSLFTDEIYVKSFLSSILIASISTFFCLLIGFPIAYSIARSNPNIRSILLMLVVLPFWTSLLIRVYAWILLLSPGGVINTVLLKLGIIEFPLQLLNNTYAACVGIIYTYLPFMILPLYGAIEKIDYSLLEAAYDLGCSPFKVFMRVIIPLSMSGIVAGSALVFVPAIGEFVIPELLGGAQTLTIGRVVWNEFFGNLSWPTAAALSIVLLVFIVLPSVIGQSAFDFSSKKKGVDDAV